MKKKIIQVIPKFCLAGAETMCENLTSAIDRSKYEVKVVSFFNYRSPITERLEQQGYEIIYLNKKKGFDFSIFFKLYLLLKKEKPDAIHTHLYILRYVLIPAKLACRNCKLIHTVHNIASKEIKKGKFLHRIAFKFLGVIPVAISDIVQASIQEEYDLKKENIPIVYNGINLNRCKQKSEHKSTNIILHIGRFTEQKNHKELLEIFKEVHKKNPQYILKLIGSGDNFESIKEYAKNLEIENYVDFAGNKSECYEDLLNADVFVMPSKWEGFPMTIIEAMGTGVPIVAYPVGGIPDMIENNKSGLLSKNKEEFIRDLNRLLRSTELRVKLGQSALKASKKFSSEYMADKYIKIYFDNNRRK